MSDGRIVRPRQKIERDFTQIRNSMLRDHRLSLKARGLLGLLWSHDPEYVISVKSLAATNREGRAAITSAIDELKRAGYLELIRVRKRTGEIQGVLWQLVDNPDERARSQPQLDYPDTDNPDTDNPDTDNQRLKEEQLKEDLLTPTEVTTDARASKSVDPVLEANERYRDGIAAHCKRTPDGKHRSSNGYRCDWCMRSIENLPAEAMSA